MSHVVNPITRSAPTEMRHGGFLRSISPHISPGVDCGPGRNVQFFNDPRRGLPQEPPSPVAHEDWGYAESFVIRTDQVSYIS